VIADDEMLLREGLARLLAEAGFDVVGKASNAPELLRSVRLTSPAVAIVDIKMPPTHTQEGLVAAQEIREQHPDTGVLVLSHYLEPTYAMRLMEQHPQRVGYLLKERVSDIAVLADGVRRIAEGECVLDPTIVRRLVDRPRETEGLGDLTDRERDVLRLVAEGYTAPAIGERLAISPKTVDTYKQRINEKAGLSARHDYVRFALRLGLLVPEPEIIS
jgi:DNA-binding NarL/FixJ family response regulator